MTLTKLIMAEHNFKNEAQFIIYKFARDSGPSPRKLYLMEDLKWTKSRSSAFKGAFESMRMIVQEIKHDHPDLILEEIKGVAEQVDPE
jgi:hypothetical protein